MKRGRKFPGLYTQTEDAEAQTKTWAEQQAMALMAVEQLRTLATAPQHRDLLPYSPAWIGEPSEPAEPVLLWHASPFGSQGSDSNADTIELSYVGGAPGTQLTRVEINGDKYAAGLSLADVVFRFRDDFV